MHEIVHLSFGPPANELNSKFYNAQQSYFVYSKADLPKSHVDPSIRFVYGKEYTPRAAFWDYRNGFGKWQHYSEKYQQPQTEESIREDQQRSATLLPQDNISTWTSHLKVPIHPSGLHTIPNWEFDPERFPFGHQRGASADEHREFATVEEGEYEFKEVCDAGTREDYLDSTFRTMLEKCDLMDGVNIVTDFGGWAGFTLPYMEGMRDDYIPKLPVFTWCISRSQRKFPWSVQKSRMEALVGLSELSSLVLPLQDDIPTDTAREITMNAESHLALFETTCLLSSLRRNRVSMHELVLDLTTGIPGANIVQDASSKQALSLNEFDGKPTHVRNTVDIWRGGQIPESIVKNSTPQREISHNLKQYWCPQPLDEDGHQQKFIVEINDNPLKLRKLAARGGHELKESVYAMTDAYIWGWDEPSDDSDVF